MARRSSVEAPEHGTTTNEISPETIATIERLRAVVRDSLSSSPRDSAGKRRAGPETRDAVVARIRMEQENGTMGVGDILDELHIHPAVYSRWKQAAKRRSTNQLVRAVLGGGEGQGGSDSIEELEAELAELESEAAQEGGGLPDGVLQDKAEVIRRRSEAMQEFLDGKVAGQVATRIARKAGLKASSITTDLSAAKIGNRLISLKILRAIADEYGIRESVLRGDCYTVNELRKGQIEERAASRPAGRGRVKTRSKTATRQPREAAVSEEAAPEDAPARAAEPGEVVNVTRMTMRQYIENTMQGDTLVDVSHIFSPGKTVVKASGPASALKDVEFKMG